MAVTSAKLTRFTSPSTVCFRAEGSTQIIAGGTMGSTVSVGNPAQVGVLQAKLVTGFGKVGRLPAKNQVNGTCSGHHQIGVAGEFG